MVGGHSKITKDQEKHKQVINAERELYYVAGHELEAGCTPVPEIDQHGESTSESNPHRTPAERFAKTDAMDSTVEYSKIEKQHRHDKKIEENPEGGLAQQIPRRFNSPAS